jgi:iron complex outermembrane recepter protein
VGGSRGKGAGLILLAFAGAALAQPRAAELADLSLEELANLPVTSVSGRAERLADAPASIYVISADDIRRSGVTSLPEALRLAPNLQVARSDASQYAISARGFNNSIGNKLLVLIDGRTVYTPLFSGVFWDQQDVLLEDVERIEVISGPGATLWGANAVNGVINVITRPARDTQGIVAKGGAGNQGGGGAFRYGGTLGEAGHYRGYAKFVRQENTRTTGGASVADGRDFGQAGFRADWRDGRDGFTLQGDGYNSRSEQRGTFIIFPLGRVEASGMNLLGRWTRSLGRGSDLSVQAYYDHSDRQEALQYSPRSDVVDLQFQHGLPLGEHKLLWGGGYRHSDDYVQPGIFFAFIPRSRGLDWANVFAQGEFHLGASLDLTLGVKFESNDYSGIEALPSARLAWKLAPGHMAWGALSRAVRAPARLDHDIRSFGFGPPFTVIGGGDQFESEIANILEIGYRGQPSRALSWSATAYANQWDRLRSGQRPPPAAFVQNMIEGDTYGFEAWGTWQVASAWRLMAGGTTLRKHLRLEPGSTDPTGPSALGNDPESQWMLRSSLNVTSNQDFDVTVRRVGALPLPAVPEYTALDLRYGWRVRRDFELSLTVQNAADPSHPEFNAAPGRSEIARSVLLAARWSY